MKLNFTCFTILSAVVLMAGCKQKEEQAAPIGPVAADSIKNQIAVLADDSLMGRKPFTAGETKTINYISSQFKKIGLEPGNNGSYFQDVPMVEVKGTPTPTMTIAGAKGNFSLKAYDERPSFRWVLAQITGQVAYRRMLHQNGMGQP